MRRVQIIGLCGPAGCGKDALADHLVSTYGYEKIRFANFLYKLIYQLPFLEDFRWANREWKESVHPFYGVSPRRMLQTLGTEWGRDLVNYDIWIKLAEWTLNERLSKRSFVFPDLRFINEATWIEKNFGITVGITRTSGEMTSIKTIAELSHSSENFSFTPMFSILNNKGLQELKDQAITLDHQAQIRANSRKS